jgi:hypothetical protein
LRRLTAQGRYLAQGVRRGASFAGQALVHIEYFFIDLGPESALFPHHHHGLQLSSDGFQTDDPGIIDPLMPGWDLFEKKRVSNAADAQQERAQGKAAPGKAGGGKAVEREAAIFVGEHCCDNGGVLP